MLKKRQPNHGGKRACVCVKSNEGDTATGTGHQGHCTTEDSVRRPGVITGSSSGQAQEAPFYLLPSPLSAIHTSITNPPAPPHPSPSTHLELGS